MVRFMSSISFSSRRTWQRRDCLELGNVQNWVNCRRFQSSPDKGEGAWMKDTFFHISALKIICCESSLGPSRQDGSNQESQHVRKNILELAKLKNQPYLELCFQIATF